MSTGVEGSEREVHGGGRESATMRESRDRDAVMRKARAERGASESSHSGVRRGRGRTRRANEEGTKATKKRECPKRLSDEEKKGGRKQNERGTTRTRGE